MASGRQRLAIIGAMAVVAGLVGWVLQSRFGAVPRPAEVATRYPVLPQPGVAMPEMPGMPPIAGAQGVLVTLMAKYALPPPIAQFLARTKITLIAETATTVHYVLTFADGSTSDETISVTPPRRYQPTPADVESRSRSGRQAFHATLTHETLSANESRFTLHYFVVTEALPPELQERIGTAAVRPQPAAWLDLIPAAAAQEGGDNGAESVAWNVAEVTKSMGVKFLEENLVSDAPAVALDQAMTLKDLYKGWGALSKWLGEIAELQACAQDPSNPLTAKAAKTAEYQRQVIDGLNDASSDITAAAIPKLANVAAGAVTQFLPFGTGVMISPITDANDEAVADFAERRIDDARKSVTPCKDSPMLPGNLRPMQATLEYAYIRKTAEQEETRKAKGSFPLDVVSGGLSGEGTADVENQVIGNPMNKVCEGHHALFKEKGQASIKGMAGGTPLGGMVRVSLTGAVPVDDTILTSEEFRCVEQTKHRTELYHVACNFDGVDMVRGGTYSTFSEADHGAGTCTLELARK